MVWLTNYNTFKPEGEKLESPSNVATIICAILGLELVVFLSFYYFDVQDKRSVVGVWMICSVGILLIVIHLFEPKDSKLRQLSVLTNTVLVLVVLIGLLLINSVQYSSRHAEILNSKVKVEDLLRHVDTVLFDFDGTLVDNNYRPKDGAAEVLNSLKRREKNVLIATNNIMLSRSEILDTLKSAGVGNICLENIYTSFLVTAIYVKQKINSGTVYVFDSYQFADELDLLNISHIGTGPDVGSKGSKFVPSDSEIDSSVEAVFVHTDKYVNQRKLSKAITYGGKVKPDLLIGHDGQPPNSPNSWSLPNGGHYIQLVAKATKRQPVVCMKPSKIFLDMMRIMEPNIALKRTLMVGDSAETDVGFAQNGGIRYSLLIGEPPSYQSASAETMNPTHRVESFSRLRELLEEAN